MLLLLPDRIWSLYILQNVVGISEGPDRLSFLVQKKSLGLEVNDWIW